MIDPVVPKAPALPASTIPAFNANPPVKLLFPASASSPTPFFVIAPVPSCTSPLKLTSPAPALANVKPTSVPASAPKAKAPASLEIVNGLKAVIAPAKLLLPLRFTKAPV